MNSKSFLEGLLQGVTVKWRPLGAVGDFIRGNGMQKKDFVEAGFPAIHYGQIYTRYGLEADRAFTFVPVSLAKRLRKANKNDLLLATTSENDEDVVKPLAWLGESVAISGDMMLFRHQQSAKYLAYVVQSEAFQEQKKKYISGAKVRRVSSSDLAKIVVPIPCPENPKKSLEIQNEIVRILDAFAETTTELTAKLAAELTARKKQYSHCRGQLLSFEGVEVEWRTLGSAFHMRAGQHISASKIMPNSSDAYSFPCFGGNGVRGFVEVKSHDGEYLLIGRQGALCGNVQRMKGQFYATEHAVVVAANDELNIDLAFHALTAMNLNQYASKSAQPGLAVGKLQDLKVSVPSLNEQERVAGILDKFEALTTSLAEMLPREIELRQKQYEYYRDLLLSFPKPEAENATTHA